MDQDTKFVVFVAVIAGVAYYMLKPKGATAAKSATAAEGLNKGFTGTNVTQSDDPLGFGGLKVDPSLGLTSVGGTATNASAAGTDALQPGQLSVDWDSLKPTSQGVSVPSPLPPAMAAPTAQTRNIKTSYGGGISHVAGVMGVV